MLDIKYIKSNIAFIQRNSEERGVNVDVRKTVELYDRFAASQRERDTLRQSLNSISQSFSILKGEEKATAQEKGKELKTSISLLDDSIKVIESEYKREMLRIPNLTDPEVPYGKTDEDNLAVKHVGQVPKFNFPVKDHLELGQDLDLIDFAAGAKVTGAKFYFLKNELVILELGLIRYALDLAIANGFQIMSTPELARDEVITASGFTPRGPESQIYSLTEGGLSLIGTSEITIGGYMSDTTSKEVDLPLKISGISHCFRTEAGSYGKESRGLYRVHQFSKVEMYQFTTPESSPSAHEEMLAIEEQYYQSLCIPYRVMLMCKGDLGAPAYKKYDIEGWMPFLGGYGELTSASNCTDFQSRRLGIKYKEKKSGKSRLVHTLNGTMVATTRTLLALMENNQNSDGSITIPKVLHKYTGIDRICPK